MSERERFLITLIYLLQQECECLRSVMSEPGLDWEIYNQYTRAEILRQARETMEHRL
jgi:hypothetical protein